MKREQLRVIPKNDLIDIIFESRNKYDFELKVNNWFIEHINNLLDEMDLVANEHVKWDKLNKQCQKLEKIWGCE